jgi:hypothetical protein
LFPGWETFYAIIGSAAGALTGLMFVVIALVPEIHGGERELDTFATPIVVHFSAPLLLSILMAAPWPALAALQIALGVFGAAGAVYMIIVTRRARQPLNYTPVFEDWLFHSVLPSIAYAGILIGAAVLPMRPVLLLFVIGGAAALLMFVGIHNAWDAVLYIIMKRWAADSDQTS